MSQTRRGAARPQRHRSIGNAFGMRARARVASARTASRTGGRSDVFDDDAPGQAVILHVTYKSLDLSGRLVTRHSRVHAKSRTDRTSGPRGPRERNADGRPGPEAERRRDGRDRAGPAREAGPSASPLCRESRKRGDRTGETGESGEEIHCNTIAWSMEETRRRQPQRRRRAVARVRVPRPHANRTHSTQRNRTKYPARTAQRL